MWLLPNPEFIRNVRGQMRFGKLVAGFAASAAISVAIGVSFSAQRTGPIVWGVQLLKTTIFLQALILAAGGGLACLNAIYREKEHNTFDYQRVTRLTPLQLTLGKLFGAPIFAYFICVCFFPLAVFAAARAQARPSFLIAAYLVILAGSVAFHTIALVLSLVASRGSYSGATLLLLLLLLIGSVGGPNAGLFQLGSLSPFFAANLPDEHSWTPRVAEFGTPYQSEMIDAFFGHPVHHVPVLILLDVIFACWFLLAVTRNIKKDPDYYQLYSPMQAVALAVFVNFTFVAFYRLGTANAIDNQAILLTLNMFVFLCIGLSLLRNREKVRRILRSRGDSPESWLDVLWPGPLLLLGAGLSVAMVVVAVTLGHDPKVDWSTGFAAFRGIFFVAWLVRDFQYLQWMSLRRGKHSLAMGVLYLLIFYACTMALLGAFGVLRQPERAPFAAFFVPSPVYFLDHSAWALRPAIWAAAFICQWLLAALFIGLQRDAIRDLTQPGKLSPVTSTV